jgi:hypothetical protein
MQKLSSNFTLRPSSNRTFLRDHWARPADFQERGLLLDESSKLIEGSSLRLGNSSKRYYRFWKKGRGSGEKAERREVEWSG